MSRHCVVVSAYFDHVQNDMCQLGPWLSLIGLVSAISWYQHQLHVNCCYLLATETAIYSALFVRMVWYSRV